jgi:MoxR-like ATPase
MPAHEQILELQKRMGQSIIGQEDVVERVLLGLLSNVLSRQPARANRPTH